MITVYIPGNPNAQKRHRDGRGFKYDPSAGDKKDFLTLCYQKRPEKPFSGPLEVNILAVYQRPKNHYGTGKNSNILKPTAPYWKTTAPDKDNLEKFIYDALQGVFWVNDSLICMGSEKKIWGDVPGVYLEIIEL